MESDRNGGIPDVKVEGIVANVVSIAEKCEGSINTQTGALPAEFTMTVRVGLQEVTLPDWGAAVVATTGGALQNAVFHGDGIYSGLFTDQTGTIKFVKIGHVFVPATSGTASAECIANVVAGGSGSARLQAAGIDITISGATIL